VTSVLDAHLLSPEALTPPGIFQARPRRRLTDDRIVRVWAHRARLEQLASKKWDDGEYENVAGMLRLQNTTEDLLAY
jgi:hypothetical protein